MPSNIEDPGVSQYIRSNLLNLKKLSSALPTSYEAEVRALRVDASKGALDRAHVKRVISDQFKHLERAKMKPQYQKDKDEACITQGPSGRRKARRKGKFSTNRRGNLENSSDDATSATTATSTPAASADSEK